MNNPYMESLKTIGSGKQHTHGGPIPADHYIVAKTSHHPHFGPSARVDRAPGMKPMGRDGFYIMAEGPWQRRLHVSA